MAKEDENDSPQIPYIQSKSLRQISDEAVTAQLDAVPRVLEAYGTYGPQFSQIASQMFVDAQKRAKDAYPEIYSAYEPVRDLILSRVNDASLGAPEGILSPFRENLRSAQASRGFAESPISAVSEARELAGVNEDYIRNIIKEGLDLADYAKTIPTVFGGDFTPGDLGLELPSVSGGIQTESQVLQPFRRDAALTNFSLQQQDYNNKKKKSNSNSKLIGGVVGGIAAPFIGVDPVTGAQAGSAIGGTFF